MITSMTSAGIFFWEMLALPFHTGRLALMNAFFRRQRHQALQAFGLERVVFQEFLAEVRDIEQDLAEAISELGLEGSRQAVADACQISLRRLRERYLDSVSVDVRADDQTAA